ncbi:hypothetical protein SELMODRAFT_422111 [Selaginella moellendorffii]|uniref:Uncharacterized protein n=1 Tax=Selaginella moellendorffii TaxID=88036 RepID=D8SHD5_SELML|nr:hypothetical protein SELMODRAFT_422111 [Selaginella moellendorffii]
MEGSRGLPFRVLMSYSGEFDGRRPGGILFLCAKWYNMYAALDEKLEQVGDDQESYVLYGVLLNRGYRVSFYKWERHPDGTVTKAAWNTIYTFRRSYEAREPFGACSTKCRITATSKFLREFLFVHNSDHAENRSCGCSSKKDALEKKSRENGDADDDWFTAANSRSTLRGESLATMVVELPSNDGGGWNTGNNGGGGWNTGEDGGGNGWGSGEVCDNNATWGGSTGEKMPGKTPGESNEHPAPRR